LAALLLEIEVVVVLRNRKDKIRDWNNLCVRARLGKSAAEPAHLEVYEGRGTNKGEFDEKHDHDRDKQT
jgi:hypothetical protein